jgi:hypothetical protein
VLETPVALLKKVQYSPKKTLTILLAGRTNSNSVDLVFSKKWQICLQQKNESA